MDLLERLWNDEYVAAYQAMKAGAPTTSRCRAAVARQMVDAVRDNAFITDTPLLGGDTCACPTSPSRSWRCSGEKDHIVPWRPLAGGGLRRVRTKTELRLKGGHVGLVVGRTAAKTTIPTIIDFLIKQSEQSQ